MIRSSCATQNVSDQCQKLVIIVVRARNRLWREEKSVSNRGGTIDNVFISFKRDPAHNYLSVLSNLARDGPIELSSRVETP